MQNSLGQSGRNLVLIVWAARGTTLTERDLEQLTVYGSLARTSLARARTVREAAARDAATLTALRDGVLVLDRKGVVRSINHAAADVLGVNREHALGRRLRDIPGLAPLALTLVGDDPTQLAQVVADYSWRNWSSGRKPTMGASWRPSATSPARNRWPGRASSPAPVFTFDDLIGNAPAFLEALEIARRASQSTCPSSSRRERHRQGDVRAGDPQ